MIKNLKQKEYVFNIITDYIEEKTGLTAEDLNYTIYDIDGLIDNEILIRYTCGTYYVELFVCYKSDNTECCDELFTSPKEELIDIIKSRVEINEDTVTFEFYDYDKKNFKRVAKAVVDYIHNNI